MINNKGQAFQETAGNFLFLGLAVLGLLSFVFLIQSDNNSVQPLSNDTLFNETANRLTTQLVESENESRIQQDLFNEETPKQGFGSIVLFGVVSAVKTFTGDAYAILALIVKIPVVMLGIEPSIFSTIIVWSIMIILIGAWIVYKLGG